MSNRLDRRVHEQALALFHCDLQAPYAVNPHVDFMLYRTTFDLAECEVTSEHWYRVRGALTRRVTRRA